MDPFQDVYMRSYATDRDVGTECRITLIQGARYVAADHARVSQDRVGAYAQRLSYICLRCMLVCMRTTLQLDDELVVRAKISAARSGRTLSQVIEDALRQVLAARAAPGRPRASVPTSPGRPRPGVHLDDNAGLLDLMDGSR